MSQPTSKVTLIALLCLLTVGCERVGRVYNEIPIPQAYGADAGTRIADEVIQDVVNGGLIQKIKTRFDGLSDEQIKELQVFRGVSVSAGSSVSAGIVIAVQFFYTSDQSEFSYQLDANKSMEIVDFVTTTIGGVLQEKLAEANFSKTTSLSTSPYPDMKTVNNVRLFHDAEKFVRTALPVLLNNCTPDIVSSYFSQRASTRSHSPSDIDRGFCWLLTEYGISHIKAIEEVGGTAGPVHSIEDASDTVSLLTVSVLLESEPAHINLLLIKEGPDWKILNLFIDTKSRSVGWRSREYSPLFDAHIEADTESPYAKAQRAR